MGISRRAKLIRFVICESIAIFALLTSATIGVRERHIHPSISSHSGFPRVSPLVSAATISAAVAVGLIPIIFFGPARLR